MSKLDYFQLLSTPVTSSGLTSSPADSKDCSVLFNLSCSSFRLEQTVWRSDNSRSRVSDADRNLSWNLILVHLKGSTRKTNGGIYPLPLDINTVGIWITNIGISETSCPINALGELTKFNIQHNWIFEYFQCGVHLSRLFLDSTTPNTLRSTVVLCCARPKAGRNIFFSRFSTFFVHFKAFLLLWFGLVFA